MTQQVTGPASGLLPVAPAVRLGVKGSGADAWLQSRGIPVPAGPNSFVQWPPDGARSGGRCLRLGSTEFLVEHDDPVAQLPVAANPDTSLPAAWTLIRADHSFVLRGALWPTELSRICSFDFERLRTEPDTVVMTLMAGIAVTFIREPAAAASDPLTLRLWCDAGYAIYLHDCLHALARSATPLAGDTR
jgi:hypothetical protein